MFDVVPLVKGVAADVGHVDSPAVTKGYTKEDDGLKHALTGAEIVIIPAGVPRKVSRASHVLSVCRTAGRSWRHMWEVLETMLDLYRPTLSASLCTTLGTLRSRWTPHYSKKILHRSQPNFKPTFRRQSKQCTDETSYTLFLSPPYPLSSNRKSISTRNFPTLSPPLTLKSLSNLPILLSRTIAMSPLTARNDP